ncbi:ATP-binding protein [Actinomadura sediminis]|uniref:ATP-binding protein n=1 Tax=Actinomadura sediminis TaxID=1038904 RepID=A0ABW3EZP2_9ACTN
MHSTPVPESSDLPPRLDRGLAALTEMTGPTVSFTVAPDPESVTEARHFTLARLDEWGLADLADDVGLVVSELVTNALRHSGGTWTDGRRTGDAVHREDAFDPDSYTQGRFGEPKYGDVRFAEGRHGAGAAGTGTAGTGAAGANAFGTGAFSDPADPLGSAPPAIRLRLVHEGPWLLCGILDASRSAPRRKEPDYIAETGRGLHLVESFSVRWGWRTLAQGKVVWALFRSEPHRT